MSYSAAEAAAVLAAAPLTYEGAIALGEKLGKSHRSVIAKAKSLGVEYTPKAKPARKTADNGPTKADVLVRIRSRLGLAHREGDLTKAELEAILSAL
jgi:hypothetical protein